MKAFGVITVFTSTASAHCAAGVENDMMRMRKSIDFAGMPMITCGNPALYDSIEGNNDKVLINAGFGTLGSGRICSRGAVTDPNVPSFEASKFCQNYAGVPKLTDYELALRAQKRIEKIPIELETFSEEFFEPLNE